MIQGIYASPILKRPLKKHANIDRQEISALVDQLIEQAEPAWDEGPLTLHRGFIRESIKPLVEKYSPISGRGQKVSAEIFQRVRDELLLNGYSDRDRFGYITSSFTKW